MRLERLFLPEYGNLRSFEISFDRLQPVTALLGKNGTGKSHLIEAIVEIFRDLELNAAPRFPYRLDYVCRERAIGIDADPDRKDRRLDITVDGKSVPYAAFKRDIDALLPNFVFAYYSGWSNRLERHFDRPTRRHYDAILKARAEQAPLRRMFFCRKDYSQLVLLAFFLTQSADARALLKQYLNIEHFESALFVLKTPWWRGGGAPNKIQRAEGDPRFWYSRGSFKGFLERLWSCSFAPIRINETVERDVRRQGDATERLYLFIKSEEALSKLGDTEDGPKAFFGHLESLFLCDLIDEVRVTIRRDDGAKVKFAHLSEGEQQLLTVLGLLLFTQDDESLYLLDEPDTHLNPVWTYDFVRLLQDNTRPDRGQLICATHNPLMIGSLRKNQVRLLSTESGRVVAREPDCDPLGVGVEGLLKSEFYGLRSSLAPEILRRLDRHYFLLGKQHRSDPEQVELMQLATELNSLGVARTHPNPYFEAFAGALARRTSQDEPAVWSKAQLAAQVDTADQVLAEVIAEERHSRDGL